MSNNRRQRGGDKAAGTLVVDDRAHRYARELRRHAERVSADLFDQDIHAADSDEMVAAAVAPENNEELDEAEDESVAATGHLNAATEEASNPAIGIAPDPHALTPSESEHEDLDPVQNASPSSWTSPFSRAASPSPLVSPEESHASTNGDPSGWTSPLSRAASLSPSEPTEEDQLKPYSYPPGWGSIVEQAGQEVGCAIPVSDFGPHLSDPAFGVEGQANPGADF